MEDNLEWKTSFDKGGQTGQQVVGQAEADRLRKAVGRNSNWVKVLLCCLCKVYYSAGSNG